MDDVKPPLILHSYTPASEGVKVENLRPRDLESILVEHTSPAALLHPTTRL